MLLVLAGLVLVYSFLFANVDGDGYWDLLVFCLLRYYGFLFLFIRVEIKIKMIGNLLVAVDKPR